MQGRLWLVIFALALFVRAGWGTWRLVHSGNDSPLEFPDERQYWEMARSLRMGEGLKDEFGFRATRMPLYPAVLSIFTGSAHGIVMAKALHWMIGAMVAGLTAGLAAMLFDRRVGFLAGLLVACDPFLVFFSSLLLTETFYLAVLVALWWILWPMLNRCDGGDSWRRWVAVGSLSAVGVYLRESSLGLLILWLCGYVLWRGVRVRRLRGVALAGLIVAGSLFPWALRNKQVTGEWCWLTHRAGISLYDGVGPQADGSSDLAAVQQMPAVRDLSEVQWNRFFLRESILAIQREPGRILRLAGVKLARLWNLVPNVGTYQSKEVRAISGLWTGGTFAFAVASMILIPKIRGANGVRLILFLLLPALYVSALHSLFVGSIRYRLPAIPLIDLLAAVSAVALFDRLASWRSSGGTATHG